VADGTCSTRRRQAAGGDVVPAVKVGDTVVYAAHGIGRVVALEQRRVAGTARDCVVVDLAGGLRVTLSLDEAAGRLRSVADRAELESLGATLGATPPARGRSWARRIGDSKAKLASGRPGDLAEIVRDGACYEQSAGLQLSHAERTIYLQARDLLVREICSARGIDADEADAWVDAQIMSPERRED
jgi:CarD family transcriptional regulator, regulator of rRNA transcription